MTKLELARKKLGFSQEFVATKLGITKQSYGRIEKGKVSTHPKHWKTLSSVLRIPESELRDASMKRVFGQINKEDADEANLYKEKLFGADVFDEISGIRLELSRRSDLDEDESDYKDGFKSLCSDHF